MKECVIWTANLDKRKSRRKGRKIPKRFSVSGVRLSELEAACKALGISCVSEAKKYPRSWWEDGGRILVEKTSSKTQLMIKLAQKISELREAEEQRKAREKGGKKRKEKGKEKKKAKKDKKGKKKK